LTYSRLADDLPQISAKIQSEKFTRHRYIIIIAASNVFSTLRRSLVPFWSVRHGIGLSYVSVLFLKHDTCWSVVGPLFTHSPVPQVSKRNRINNSAGFRAACQCDIIIVVPPQVVRSLRVDSAETLSVSVPNKTKLIYYHHAADDVPDLGRGARYHDKL